MKATKAYIASLGTTGVLLAASILMLAVVSAVVAFNAWPGAGVPNRVQTLVLAEKPAAIRVSTHSTAAPAVPSTHRAAAVSSAGARGPVAPQRIAVQPLSGGAGPHSNTPTPAAKPAPAPAGAPKPLQSVQQTTDPIIAAVSNPDDTAGQVANGAQGVTDAVGVGLGKINPDLGQLVTQVGETAAQAVRDLPLPQHLLPGQ